MKAKYLGSTHLPVTEIGLGCWQLGSDWGSLSPETDKAHSLKILRAAADNGIRFFDTADVYGAGISESVIGEFLSSCPQAGSIKVATKFGRDASVFPDNYSCQALRDSVAGSCERLWVECLDLLQLHCVPLA